MNHGPNSMKRMSFPYYNDDTPLSRFHQNTNFWCPYIVRSFRHGYKEAKIDIDSDNYHFYTDPTGFTYDILLHRRSHHMGLRHDNTHKIHLRVRFSLRPHNRLISYSSFIDI